MRLLQIDIAVKDDRAGTTGWYFATYAFDRNAPGTSSWLKMVPIGLMWGNDPKGTPLQELWINPSAPAYAKAHLGADGRLNGPVDNRASACLSCHSTAQAPTLADMLPTGSCASQRPNWFRNLAGSQPFGRFDDRTPACDTSLSGLTVTSADYSLQLAPRSRAPSPRPSRRSIPARGTRLHRHRIEWRTSSARARRTRQPYSPSHVIREKGRVCTALSLH